MANRGWIDAAKRWPDRIGTYLVCVAGCVVCATWCGGGIWLRDGAALNVSHWQPLPEPPARNEWEVQNAVHNS